MKKLKYTGPRVKIEGYDIGGKTGTAELIINRIDYDKDSNRTIFIGAFPMSNPKYLVLTFIDKPKRKKEYNYSITSATVNAPLVKNIILRMIEILKVPKYENHSKILNAATSINYNQRLMLLTKISEYIKCKKIYNLIKKNLSFNYIATNSKNKKFNFCNHNNLKINQKYIKEAFKKVL